MRIVTEEQFNQHIAPVLEELGVMDYVIVLVTDERTRPDLAPEFGADEFVETQEVYFISPDLTAEEATEIAESLVEELRLQCEDQFPEEEI